MAVLTKINGKVVAVDLLKGTVTIGMNTIVGSVEGKLDGVIVGQPLQYNIYLME